MLLRLIAAGAFASCAALAGCRAVEDSPRLALGSGLTEPGRTLARSLRLGRATSQTPAQFRPDARAMDCGAEWARVERLDALPGTPKLGSQRAEMLARAKGEPVFFVSAPSYEKSDSAVVRGYRRALTQARFPWETLRQIKDRFPNAPRIGRQVLLRDGYLYAESADLGWALWDAIRLEHLFDEPALWLERGSGRLRITRDPKRGYVYADGPDAGKPARILLFDRVGVEGVDPGPALHRDARGLAHELGFDRMTVVRTTESAILANLRFGDVWVRSVLASDGAHLSRRCEIVEAGSRAKLDAARAKSEVRARVVAALQREILRAVDEELPFDEPKTEWGQQDGHLRSHWQKAYEKGESHYAFQSDLYPVFRPDGRVAPPQVCIDFVTETLERASGTWWRPRGEPPGRDLGGLDFEPLLGDSRRKVTHFIAYTKEHPEQFQHELLPTSKRLPYVFKRQFYRHLAREADHYAPGTIVVIRGFAPWDHYNVPHYHTFFVYESDPLTGVPMLLAGNAGKPRVQTWETVMSRAPQRNIEYRITPNIDWLAKAIPDAGTPRVVPSLVEVF